MAATNHLSLFYVYVKPARLLRICTFVGFLDNDGDCDMAY